MRTSSTPLTNLQRELIKLFAREVPEEDLKNIKQLIANYFAKKTMDAADKAWEEKGWTDEDIQQQMNTKMRSPI